MRMLALLKRLSLLLLLFAGLPQFHAQAQTEANQAAAKLVVGTMRVPPFASRGDDGIWTGLSIELWQKVAAELNRDFEFREYDYDLEGLLKAVEHQQIDVAIAALPVTYEGEAHFDFSHPYFAAGLGIAVRSEPQHGVLVTLAAFLTPQLLVPIAALGCVLLVVGALVWFTERRHNPGHFDPRPLQGVGDGVWWAAVTMTTTGYGDKTPITWRGRAIALVWMFTSIFCIAMFSATLASSFVVGRLKTTISGPGDLPRARVAIVSGSAGAHWADQQGLKTQAYPFVIQASKALQRGEVDALVFERAILGHMIKQYAWTDIQLLPQILAVHDYALAVPTGSPLEEPVNRALLKITRQPDWTELIQRYVGSDDR